jgi:hypothetical protein
MNRKNTILRTVGKMRLWLFAAGLVFFMISQAQGKNIKHLVATDNAADCYECHKYVTPRVAQNWLESKHGVQLMKCFVCHGQPDGKGSVPFRVVPDPGAVCVKCHDPAMKRMAKKFGTKKSCYECHPFHQNSLHHDAYKKSASKTQ